MDDVIDIQTGSVSSCHVFFVAGNPGLISYYSEFFHHLQLEVNERICPQLSKAHGRKYEGINLFGKSLGGFELHEAKSGYYGKLGEARRPPLSLDQQINFIEEQLEIYARTHNESQDGGSKKLKIILIGHSVGAYIILELLRRRNERLKGYTDGADRQHPLDANADLVSGILLFPTIEDIAKSPHGQKASLALSVPQFPTLVGYLARFVTAFIPLAALTWVVQKITGMPPNPAKVTANFLKTKMGVTQALFMARDEMNMIKSESWNEEIWGTTYNKLDSLNSAMTRPRSKLYFFFGRGDHWVAEQTREELIATRANANKDLKMDESDQALIGDSRPFMQVDETGLPHSFCLRYSRSVALVVARYIEEILTENVAG